MKTDKTGRAGFFSFVLHAHLPYVLHHGTWPHGTEWLLEAAAETYLPLIRTMKKLAAEGVSLCVNLSFSPVLLEQLAHPDFKAELPNYLRRKILAAQEDAGFFEQMGEGHPLYLARHWETLFRQALDDLQALDGDVVAGLRALAAIEGVSFLTSAATHGYAPLLGTDEGVHAQFATAVASHARHMGEAPQGVWLPECGYRPAGKWQFPVPPAESAAKEPAKPRKGVEQALSDAGLRFTFVDTHLFEDATRVPQAGAVVAIDAVTERSAYRPYLIAGSDVAAFARDPRTAFQVWSAQYGYPGDFQYLDFHKKRWPGGHRYWRVTGSGTGMDEKQPYYPEAAEERSRAHAEHFVGLIAETLRANTTVDGVPPIVCAPFDLELFGHWWHEGTLFLENVARVLARAEHGVEAITCADYLKKFGTAGRLNLPEGSWGANGDNSVWLNTETSAVYAQIYAAELAVRSMSMHKSWTDGAAGERLATQLCRELLLMESSDWPTLITTGAARDYAEKRFREHTENFAALQKCWDSFVATGTLDETAERVLADSEALDGIFPDLKVSAWRA